MKTIYPSVPRLLQLENRVTRYDKVSGFNNNVIIMYQGTSTRFSGDDIHFSFYWVYHVMPRSVLSWRKFFGTFQDASKWQIINCVGRSTYTVILLYI